MTSEPHADPHDPGGGGPAGGGAQAGASGDRVVIVVNGDLRRMTVEAEEALRVMNAASPTTFELGAAMVRVSTKGDRPRLERLDVDRLRRLFADRIEWRALKKKRGWEIVHPPLAVVRNVLAGQGWGLPPVDRLVTVPVFAPDGSLVIEPGYSPAGRVFYAPEVDVPTVPERPSRADLERALALIGETLDDFPFVAPGDRAHAIGAMLLPFIRAMILGPTPLFLVTAPPREPANRCLPECSGAQRTVRGPGC